MYRLEVIYNSKVTVDELHEKVEEMPAVHYLSIYIMVNKIAKARVTCMENGKSITFRLSFPVGVEKCD